MAGQKRRDWGHVLAGGLAAGVFAGAVLAVVMLIAAVITGTDPWLSMKAASLPFMGEAAREPGFDLIPILIATIAHFGVAVAWGLLFAALLYGASKSVTMMAGPFYGVLVFIAMFYAVLPAIGLVDFASGTLNWLALLEHAVYGLALAIGFLPFQHEIRRRSMRQPKRMHAVMH